MSGPRFVRPPPADSDGSAAADRAAEAAAALIRALDALDPRLGDLAWHFAATAGPVALLGAAAAGAGAVLLGAALAVRALRRARRRRRAAAGPWRTARSPSRATTTRSGRVEVRSAAGCAWRRDAAEASGSPLVRWRCRTCRATAFKAGDRPPETCRRHEPSQIL